MMEYLRLSRPFTLIFPAAAFIAVYSIAGGSLGAMALGLLSAVLLNAGSNALNQICDLGIDSINKPRRPIPSGSISTGSARTFSASLYASSLLLAALVNVIFLTIVASTAIVTLLYSAEPIRLRRHWLTASFSIALTRGFLLVIAAWSAVSGITPVALAMGTMLSIFLFGASNTKDFSDIRGDRAFGVKSLPIRMGRTSSVRLISPFLVLPFLLSIPLALSGIFPMRALTLSLFSIWGLWIALTLGRESKSMENNHPAWIHMYLLMIALQAGFIFSLT